MTLFTRVGHQFLHWLTVNLANPIGSLRKHNANTCSNMVLQWKFSFKTKGVNNLWCQGDFKSCPIQYIVKDISMVSRLHWHNMCGFSRYMWLLTICVVSHNMWWFLTIYCFSSFKCLRYFQLWRRREFQICKNNFQNSLHQWKVILSKCSKLIYFVKMPSLYYLAQAH